ncbi:MAG: hypothetical protein AB1585_16700 [Thermodesulfobacteriota bacterium]
MLKEFTVDEKELLTVIQDMICIESVNPDPAIPGRDFMRQWNMSIFNPWLP